MARHIAVFRFTSDHAGQIFRSLEPELPDDVNTRSRTRCALVRADQLELTVEADDLSSLRAALNMYLRLVSVADEVASIAKKD